MSWSQPKKLNSNKKVECFSKTVATDTNILADFSPEVNQIIKNKLLSSKAIYLLRWKSGYYNYFTKDDLVFFPEVRKYGLPKDYHMPSFDIKRITMYSKILVLIVD